eukprot:1934847-Amphidinium_carterae.3
MKTSHTTTAHHEKKGSQGDLCLHGWIVRVQFCAHMAYDFILFVVELHCNSTVGAHAAIVLLDASVSSFWMYCLLCQKSVQLQNTKPPTCHNGDYTSSQLAEVPFFNNREARLSVLRKLTLRNWGYACS